MTQSEAQADSAVLVGQTVGKYKIVKLLGEGGMGCVYLAEQQLGTNTRKVALKTLHKHLSHDPSIKARFDREAGTVAALEHPNTIQVYDFGHMDDGTLYLVMEYVQGKSVAEILEKDGPMQPTRVEHILRQVCGSLEEAHSHGIVHRDLKPDNVVLCERAGQKDWVEVLDFGIAKRSSEHDPNEAKLTQQGMVLGTPPYMSPEQFTGQPIDLRSDIYALGVMAYEMLSGKLPWEANTAWEWASRHMTEAPTPIERQPLGANVPEKMRAAITKALAKNKDERFATVKEFFEALSNGMTVSSGTAVVAPAGAGAGGTAAFDAPPPDMPTSPGAAGRVKTEMGQPMVGGPSMGGSPPAFSAPAASPPVIAPAAPAQAQKKSNGLVFALAGIAALLLVGAVIAVVAGKKKTVDPVATVDLGGGTTTSQPVASTSAHVDEPPPLVTAAAPLDTSGTTAALNNASSSGGGAAPSKPTVKPVPTPVPTPTPAKPEPPDCKKARDLKRAGLKAAAADAEAKCRAAGGVP